MRADAEQSIQNDSRIRQAAKLGCAVNRTNLDAARARTQHRVRARF